MLEQGLTAMTSSLWIPSAASHTPRSGHDAGGGGLTMCSTVGSKCSGMSVTSGFTGNGTGVCPIFQFSNDWIVSLLVRLHCFGLLQPFVLLLVDQLGDYADVSYLV